MSLLSELKQRKVFRVAAAYAVVAWLLIEVVSVVLPALQLPEWTVTFTTILLLLGFPVALVLSWSFDIVRDRAAAPPSLQFSLNERCVAVLPFANMTEDAAQTHFADGLVEDILTRLQVIEWLKVVSRQSAFAYKGRGIDTRTMLQEAMLRLLGTPADRKQRIVFDAGHGYLPHNQFVRATLDWYDKHLGPVE